MCAPPAAGSVIIAVCCVGRAGSKFNFIYGYGMEVEVAAVSEPATSVRIDSDSKIAIFDPSKRDFTTAFMRTLALRAVAYGGLYSTPSATAIGR